MAKMDGRIVKAGRNDLGRMRGMMSEEFYLPLIVHVDMNILFFQGVRENQGSFVLEYLHVLLHHQALHLPASTK
jgi:hypothetical protein